MDGLDKALSIKLQNYLDAKTNEWEIDAGLIDSVS